MNKIIKRVWIEAEMWEKGEWDYIDGNTDVIVTLCDDSSWGAVFFTYKNILSLAKKNKETEECLSGKYFWAANMCLVDKIDRVSIEKVVEDLIKEGDLKYVFKKDEQG